jgi:hypothetical protein
VKIWMSAECVGRTLNCDGLIGRLLLELHLPVLLHDPSADIGVRLIAVGLVERPDDEAFLVLDLELCPWAAQAASLCERTVLPFRAMVAALKAEPGAQGSSLARPPARPFGRYRRPVDRRGPCRASR